MIGNGGYRKLRNTAEFGSALTLQPCIKVPSPHAAPLKLRAEWSITTTDLLSAGGDCQEANYTPAARVGAGSADPTRGREPKLEDEPQPPFHELPARQPDLSAIGSALRSPIQEVE